MTKYTIWKSGEGFKVYSRTEDCFPWTSDGIWYGNIKVAEQAIAKEFKNRGKI